MKILLYIFILSFAFTASGQINQKTAMLRKQYPILQLFELERVPVQAFQRNFIPHETRPLTASILSTDHYPKPSTHSIQEAFNYYNNQKKNDYSAFVMMGYSMIANKDLINTAPAESVRFFPGNSRD